MRRVDRESWKESKLKRERNEKHKVKNEESKKERNLNRENFCWHGTSKIGRINQKEKKECVLKKKWSKNKENETSETRYFVERDRNRREMAKKQKMKQTDFTGKREMITKREKTRRYTKGKKENTRRKRKVPTRRNYRRMNRKWWKRRR